MRFYNASEYAQQQADGKPTAIIALTNSYRRNIFIAYTKNSPLTTDDLDAIFIKLDGKPKFLKPTVGGQKKKIVTMWPSALHPASGDEKKFALFRVLDAKSGPRSIRYCYEWVD